MAQHKKDVRFVLRPYKAQRIGNMKIYRAFFCLDCNERKKCQEILKSGESFYRHLKTNLNKKSRNQPKRNWISINFIAIRDGRKHFLDPHYWFMVKPKQHDDSMEMTLVQNWFESIKHLFEDCESVAFYYASGQYISQHSGRYIHHKSDGESSI